MRKRITTVFLICALLFTSFGTKIFAATSELKSDLQNSKVLTLSDYDEFFTEVTDSVNVNNFNNTELSKYSDYELILVDNNSLLMSNANKLVELIDNGSILWIVDNSISLKEVSKILNLNEPDDRFMRGAQVTGAFIFNQNNEYCFGVTGVAFADSEKSNQISEELDSYESIPIYQNGDKFERSTIDIKDFKVDLADFINSVNKIRVDYNEHASSELETDKVYMQLPSKSFSGAPFYSYVSFFSGKKNFGSAAITQYRYDICSYKVGKIKKTITDVVSSFTISPIDSLYVNNYKVSMRSNALTMKVIGQSYLTSNSSSSYTLSGGFSANGTVLSGSVGGSTSNSYSTNNQTITNSFLLENQKYWSSKPTIQWKSASWELEPCIRIINENASSYKTSAFSSFQEDGWIGSSLHYSIPFFEVGGYW